MQNRSVAAAVLATTSFGAAAQTHLDMQLCTFNGVDWVLSARLHNPVSTVLATIADLGFTFTGSNIANFEYNPSFDSDFFGAADVTVTSSSVDFLGGNTLPPLNNAGGVDSSNPLHIASFTADNVDQFSFALVGQVTGAYVGTPFPSILTYQNADGSAGDTRVFFDFCIPSPSSASLLAIGSLAALPRRRR
jgi:hypothetical protein